MDSSNAFETGTAVADEKIKRRISNRKKSICDRELLIAADLGTFTNVSELIEKGADCNFVDKDGNTALFYAIESSATEDKKLMIVELLLRKGASITVENADCESPLDVANKSKARNIITLIKKQIVTNSIKIIEEILDQQQKHSQANIEENLPGQKNYYNRIEKKVEKKVKVCLDALESLTSNGEKVESFTYENGNVVLLFLEAFALQDTDLNQDQKGKLIDSYFGKEDNEVIKSVRNFFMHRGKQKVIIKLEYLEKIVSFYEEAKIFEFFCELKDYVQMVYDKFCKKQNINEKKLPIAKIPVSNIMNSSEKSPLDMLHTLVKEAYSVEQDQGKQEQVMFNLIVNIFPLLETDFKDGDLIALTKLRNELVHNFHKHGANLNIRRMELTKSLCSLNHTLSSYYYAQRVFAVLESIKPGEDSKEIDKKLDEELTQYLAKDALRYEFWETLFQKKDDTIKELVDQYLKFMVIVDGTKKPIEDELDEDGKVIEKKTYILLSDVKRRYFFEKFLMLRTIRDLKHEEYYQEQKKELIQELSDYGIESDTVNSVCETYVQNNEDFENDEFKNNVTETIETLNSFFDQIDSVQDVISLYNGSKKIDQLMIDTRTLKDRLDGLPKDQSVNIQINDDEFIVRLREIVINIFQTFYIARNKYQLKFTNEDAFNDKTFLDFLASKSIEQDTNNTWEFNIVGCVLKNVKTLLNIGYSAPYIVRLLVKVKSSDVMEKDDLGKLIQGLLKKEGLYADHLNDLLSVKKRSDGIDLYKIVCEEVIEKNLMFEKMRAVLKTPKHMKEIVNKLIEKAKQPQNREKAAELAKEIVKVTNSIASELHGIGKYDDALKMLFGKKEMIKSGLIEKEDIYLLCSEYIRARIKNQQGIEGGNIETRKKYLEAADKTLNYLVERTNGIDDHNKPYRFLILAEKVHNMYLRACCVAVLEKYDEAYDACTLLYKEIRKYVLGLNENLSLKNDEEEYHKIFNSKKYQNLLTFSDEAQKYVDIVNIKSRQAYIKSEEGKFEEALPVFKKVYSYRKWLKDRYIIRAMRNIAYSCAKLGWNALKSDENLASQCYHEGLLMNTKAYEIRSKKFFSHTSNTKYMKHIALSLINIANLKHHYGKKKNEKEYYEKAGEIYNIVLLKEKKFFGDQHEYTSKTKLDFARLKNDFGSYYYFHLSNIEQANKCHKEALELFVEAYDSRKSSKDDEGILFARKDIAFTYDKLGQVNKSVDHYDKALEIYDFLRKKDWQFKDQCQKLYEETSERRRKLNWRS